MPNLAHSTAPSLALPSIASHAEKAFRDERVGGLYIPSISSILKSGIISGLSTYRNMVLDETNKRSEKVEGNLHNL